MNYTPNILPENGTKKGDYTFIRKRYLCDQIRALNKQKVSIEVDEAMAPIISAFDGRLFDKISAINFKLTLTLLIQDYKEELHDLIDRWEEINS